MVKGARGIEKAVDGVVELRMLPLPETHTSPCP